MARIRTHSLKSERGQALAIVLALLAIGGLTIAANLNYATSSLKRTSIAEEDARGIYAAAAGIEHALWSLNSGIATSNATPENINGMAVTIDTVGGESMTLSLGELITPGEHADWIDVSVNITPAGGSTNNYTITITTSENMSPNKKLLEFGAVLPAAYSYIAGSSASWHDTNLSSEGNPSIDEPTDSGSVSGGAPWIKWAWDSGKGPSVTSSTNYTQQFQISGSGSTFGTYAWVIGQSSDIGTVGQITGVLTTITSTARRPEDDKITGRIVAEAIVGGGGVYVFSWQISR